MEGIMPEHSVTTEVTVSTKAELKAMTTCPSCGEKRTSHHEGYLPVPDGYVVGEQFLFSCPSCGTNTRVKSLPRSKEEI